MSHTKPNSPIERWETLFNSYLNNEFYNISCTHDLLLDCSLRYESIDDPNHPFYKNFQFNITDANITLEQSYMVEQLFLTNNSRRIMEKLGFVGLDVDENNEESDMLEKKIIDNFNKESMCPVWFIIVAIIVSLFSIFMGN